MKKVLLLSLLVAACRDAPHDAGPALAAASVAPSAPPAPSRSTKAQQVEPIGTGPVKALAVVYAWNAAINAHDVDLLSPLYADSVELYGTKMPRAQALAAKKASFATHARDDLSSIEIRPDGHAQFLKRSLAKSGKVVLVTGYLDLHMVKGAWVIDAEGDTTTDSNLVRAKSERCEAAVGTLVYATEEAKKAQRDIMEGAKTSAEPVGVGGMIRPPDPGGSTWEVAICENRPDRMPCYYHFDVDVARGTVTSEAFGERRLIATDRALEEKVVTACK